MAKYEQDVKELLRLLGGRENIQAVSHCMTRMRFVLADEKKAEEKEIEKLASVKGTFTQAGQYQVIIGNEVSDFYNEFTDYAGIKGDSKEATKQTAREHQSLPQRILGSLGEIFAPIIPALICGGLVLGIRNIIGEVNLFGNGTQSLADISQFWSGLYHFLWLIGEAVFHLLPVGIVWSITKKMGTTQMLGIVLGLTLVSPQLLNGFSVANTPPADIPVWDFGFVKVRMIGYQGQVIAAIMAGFILVYLEKFFRKHTPEMVSMIVVPFCSLIPAVVLAHTVVGPIGWAIGNWIADVVYSGLTSRYGFLFAGVFGLLYAPMVMTGLHHMTNAIDTTLSSAFGGTILWPMIALSNIAQGSSVLAMSVLQKKNERAEQINVPALISCYLGVTEPALFGVNLKYGFPLVCGMVGSAIAAMISVGAGVQAFSIGVGGIPGILSIFARYWGVFLLCMVIAIVVPFLLTFLVGRKKLSPQERNAQVPTASSGEDREKAEENHTQIPAGHTDCQGQLKAILSGNIIPIERVPDEVFSKRIMGDGIGFEPESDTVCAPANATVSVVMEESKHACGLVLENGMELLIHVGIDTVDMGGEGFHLHVRAGESVRCGQPLITFTPEKILEAGHSNTTVLLVTEPGSTRKMQFYTDRKACVGETVVATYE